MRTLTPTSCPSSSMPGPPSRRRPGFTLVELLIATVVLAVGLLALTTAGVAIIRLESRGQQLSAVATAGETRLELLRHRGCAVESGASESDRLEERWRVLQVRPRILLVTDSVFPEVSGGAALPHTYAFRSAVRC